MKLNFNYKLIFIEIKKENKKSLYAIQKPLRLAAAVR